MISWCFWVQSYSQSVIINNFEELLDFAKKHNYTKNVNAKQIELAKLTTRTAIGNVLNPRIPTTASIIDNSKQPVSFIPAEIFGGPAGTYREVTMGQRYISNLSFSPQFDIINLGNYARIQSARVNEKLVEINGILAEEAQSEQLNGVYYNILGYKTQKEMLLKNQRIADSILQIVQQKYAQGLIRPQEINDAKFNKITIEDKIEQLNFLLKQQYTILKMLCDVEEEVELFFKDNETILENVTVERNDLKVKQLTYQGLFLEAEKKAAMWQQLPTLSFVSNISWQNNSNNRFFDPNSNLINSNYWGLRLNWDLPTNVNKLSAYKTAQINSQLAEINQKHSQLQNNSENQQLKIEYQQTIHQYQNQQKLLTLKQENFEKSRNQYDANLLSLDKLLLAHNDLILQESMLLNAKNAVLFTKSKIEINNSY